MVDLSRNVDTTELDEDDLTDTLEEIGRLSGRYENVATCLRVKQGAVDRIKSERLNSDAALMEVVREWLKKNYNVKRFGPPSWKTLVEAVAKPAGGNDRALAEKIANRHQAGGFSFPEKSHRDTARGAMPQKDASPQREMPKEMQIPPAVSTNIPKQQTSQFRELVILPKEPNWFGEGAVR